MIIGTTTWYTEEHGPWTIRTCDHAYRHSYPMVCDVQIGVDAARVRQYGRGSRTRDFDNTEKDPGIPNSIVHSQGLDHESSISTILYGKARVLAFRLN
jgi:hypothetical protein